MKNGDFNDKFGIESHYKTRTWKQEPSEVRK